VFTLAQRSMRARDKQAEHLGPSSRSQPGRQGTARAEAGPTGLPAEHGRAQRARWGGQPRRGQPERGAQWRGGEPSAW
jgi:hypothetical protein